MSPLFWPCGVCDVYSINANLTNAMDSGLTVHLEAQKSCDARRHSSFAYLVYPDGVYFTLPSTLRLITTG